MLCPYSSVRREEVMPDAGKCLIRLTEEALLVANTGQGFTRRGVVAICASHLGTKHNYTPSDPCPSEPDDCVLEAIRERELQTYKTNPGRIFSDFREEEEIQHDYGGRALEKREGMLKSGCVSSWKSFSSSGSVRDRVRRETDILLRKGEKEVHIEVKHMKSDPRLYWSEREVSKAKEHRGRYLMALLSPSAEEGYDVCRLWDPLNDLRECWKKRTIGGVWIWERRQVVDFQELTEEPWQIPNPRANQEANNFSFEIRLNGLKCSATGLEAILTKLPLIEQARRMESKT